MRTLAAEYVRIYRRAGRHRRRRPPAPGTWREAGRRGSRRPARIRLTPVALVHSPMTVALIVILVVGGAAGDLPDRRLQRPDPPAQPDRERLVADRRPAQAPPRPDPQPRRDRQGLRRPRAGDARRRDPGPQRGDGAARTRRTPRPRPTDRSPAPCARLFALGEAYPDLKANQNFLALQEELTATEGRVAYARQFYNDSVLDYNNKLSSSRRCSSPGC